MTTTKKINSLLIVSRLTVPSVKAYLSIFYFVANMTYLSVHFALVIPLYCQGRCRNECLLCKLENVKTQGSCWPIAAFSVCILFMFVLLFFLCIYVVLYSLLNNTNINITFLVCKKIKIQKRDSYAQHMENVSVSSISSGLLSWNNLSQVVITVRQNKTTIGLINEILR